MVPEVPVVARPVETVRLQPEARRDAAASVAPTETAAAQAQGRVRQAKRPVVDYVVSLVQAPEIGRRHFAAGAPTSAIEAP